MEDAIRVGARFKSAVCSTEVIVIRTGPDHDVELTCGGSSMVPVGSTIEQGAAPSDDANGGTELGKRYVDEEADLELLCTKAGEGSLAVSGRPMELKAAKLLPSSD